MKIVIGLGNPGSGYDATRHNIGYHFVDAIAQQHQAQWQEKSRFKGIVAEYSQLDLPKTSHHPDMISSETEDKQLMAGDGGLGSVGILGKSSRDGEKVILLKPTTYYNLVGESVRAAMGFYKLSLSDILVIHDDLALPFGSLRTRLSGRDAGNNGVKSLIAHLGPDFARIRVGIANDHLRSDNATDFVLGHFTADERQKLDELIPHVATFVEHFISSEVEFQPTSITS